MNNLMLKMLLFIGFAIGGVFVCVCLFLGPWLLMSFLGWVTGQPVHFDVPTWAVSILFIMTIGAALAPPKAKSNS